MHLVYLIVSTSDLASEKARVLNALAYADWPDSPLPNDGSPGRGGIASKGKKSVGNEEEPCERRPEPVMNQ